MINSYCYQLMTWTRQEYAMMLFIFLSLSVCVSLSLSISILINFSVLAVENLL